ncbi:MAG: hypothetical protein COU85_00230 [Candidatus Portnoybacteria bacterium CG10_big_fil_rev_8_21_14_0_10_44_7]|uniref:Uncharacterized protein n=1 Tax=Candidatus Portnoybacteria bacterium CG10_big_fil_rev_8_21_14_0_10_44_7 TaxID=1974816 RepID=A0A2M8KJH3_9BACT|nr:MAG: hypothetical protein COU85_00230 [Candidatus Portnoybacteria bacterium CG10_big_fil_rev_8_21_14_0_10_44_7]
MFHFSGLAAALCAETLNQNIEILNKFQIQIFKIKKCLIFEILITVVCFGFRLPATLRIARRAGILCFEFLRKTRLAVVCTAGLPHSEIPGSKVASHLAEAYRRHATSFVAFLCLGIHHTPLLLTLLKLKQGTIKTN